MKAEEHSNGAEGMSQSGIPRPLRDMVRQRALGLCEYCLLHETDTIHGFHVDHVISEKHGGPTAEHLAPEAHARTTLCASQWGGRNRG